MSAVPSTPRRGWEAETGEPPECHRPVRDPVSDEMEGSSQHLRCPLTSIPVPWHMCVHINVNAHKTHIHGTHTQCTKPRINKRHRISSVVRPFCPYLLFLFNFMQDAAQADLELLTLLPHSPWLRWNDRLKSACLALIFS